MFEDYVHYDGLGLAKLIATGEVHPKEVLEAAILRAEKLNPELNAIVTPLYDYAHGQLRHDRTGLFAGVPFLLKDAHHALEETPMSNGSRLHKGERSTFTAEIVRRFLGAGLVIFGKTCQLPPVGSSASSQVAAVTRSGQISAGSTRGSRPPTS